jgi:hypothetical protein
MKRRANRLAVDTLYVLGAGASKALTDVATRTNDYSRRSTPVDRDFLKVLDHFSLKQGWQKRSLEQVTSNWLGEADLLGFGLEAAVIKRVADYDMLSALYPDKSRRKCSNEDYLHHLSHLIADYLLKCRSNASGQTRKFVKAVFPPGQAVDDYRNRIITFNYDLIVDRPLLDRKISKRKIYFDRLVASRHDGTKRSGDEKFLHPLLLKLHGSLNWRCEREYFNQITNGSVDPALRIPIWSNDTKCPSPDDDESPLIIPPVPNKPITKASIFRMLWTSALEYLHEAKRIVIVGYSCPATDVLAQSMFTQFRNMDVEEIVIVDPASDSLSRYHQLMTGRVRKTIGWQYFGGFREYIEKSIS